VLVITNSVMKTAKGSMGVDRILFSNRFHLRDFYGGGFRECTILIPAIPSKINRQFFLILNQKINLYILK